MKRRGDRIVMVTAYDMPSARFAEDAGIDVLLVGDTAAMVVLGYDGTTVPVTMDEMLLLTRTVARAARRPIVVGDMPFGSYQVSDEDAVRNAVRFVKEAGADAVKLEGAGTSLSRVSGDRRRRDPRDGARRAHALSPRPSSAGSRPRGRPPRPRRKLVLDASALESAGCFSIVLEAIPSPVASTITDELSIPTIGIGAGPHCDGQVLVYHDLLGLERGASTTFRQALRQPLARDPRRPRALRSRGAKRRVPRRRAQLRHGGGGALAVPGSHAAP